MRTLVHLSDLHFGRIDEALITPLLERVAAITPDLVVVSGDLTQRARSAQFKAARAFLDALPAPLMVVPGNHDIPLHNVFNRFVRPLQKYRRYITDELEPAVVDAEIAVLGVNTARSATFKGGRINSAQMARLQERLQRLDAHVIKIVVTHHPFDLPAHFDPADLVGRAPLAMRIFADCGVDLLLAGHLHASHAGDTALRYRYGDYAALAVHAGTATSTRGRGEVNSFNVVRIAASRSSLPGISPPRSSPARITVERYGWIAERSTFACASSQVFERTAQGWSTVNAGAESG